MYKRFVVIIVAVFVLLSGCSSKQTDTDVNFKIPTEVILWHYYLGNNKNQLEAAVKEFNNTVGLEKGIVVTPVEHGSIMELEEAVTNASLGLIDSQQMPDIFSIYPDKAVEFAEKNLLCDLKKYLTEDEQKKYVGSFLNDGILCKDELLMLPVAKSTEFLYINATDFEEFCKVSGRTYKDLETWEGIMDTARDYYQYTDSLTEKVGDGKAFIGCDTVANYAIVSSVQLGNDIVDADNRRAVLDTKILKRIFENYYIGHIMGYYAKYGKFRADDIKTGLIISFIGSSSGAGYFPTWIEVDGKTSDIDLKLMNYPTFQGGTPYSIRQGAGMCVTKTDTDSEKAAVEFLKWFTDTKTNIDFTKETGYIPVTNEAYTDEMMEYIESLSDKEDPIKKNTMLVYKAAMEQMLNGNTYSAKPFIGSYEIRQVLDQTLPDITDEGIKLAKKLREEGKSEAEILKEINIDEKFDLWLQKIHSQLRSYKVAYEDR